ncbi:MAG: hypothetical protein ACK5QX_07815, partial [bacterium]
MATLVKCDAVKCPMLRVARLGKECLGAEKQVENLERMLDITYGWCEQISADAMNAEYASKVELDELFGSRPSALPIEPPVLT